MEDGLINGEFNIYLMEDGDIEIYTDFDDIELIHLLLGVFEGSDKIYQVFKRAMILHGGNGIGQN